MSPVVRQLRWLISGVGITIGAGAVAALFGFAAVLATYRRITIKGSYGGQPL